MLEVMKQPSNLMISPDQVAPGRSFVPSTTSDSSDEVVIVFYSSSIKRFESCRACHALLAGLSLNSFTKRVQAHLAILLRKYGLVVSLYSMLSQSEYLISTTTNQIDPVSA